MRTTQSFLLAMMLAAGLGGGAHATAFFSLGGISGTAPAEPGPAPFEQLAVTFDHPSASYVTEQDNVSHGSILYDGSLTDIAAAPAGDATAFEALGMGQTATFTFGTQTPQIHTISVYVGSIDSYNQISILGAGGRVEDVISGGTITQSYSSRAIFGSLFAWGDQSDWSTNRRLYITDLPSDFTGIEFSSSGIAFEYDDIAVSDVSFTGLSATRYLVMPDLAPAAPAPEPATWATTLLGSALAGGALRTRTRRRKGSQA